MKIHNFIFSTILHRADAQGNDMSERLRARAISSGKHARSKSQIIHIKRTNSLLLIISS